MANQNLNNSFHINNMNRDKTEYYENSEPFTHALTRLAIPSKGQSRGHYLLSYKESYDVLKDLFGDDIKTEFPWDASLTGRVKLKKALNVHLNTLKRVDNERIKRNIERKTKKKIFQNKVKVNRDRIKRKRVKLFKKQIKTKQERLLEKQQDVFILIDEIPIDAMKLANDNGLNLYEMFELTFQPATNPELTLTKIFRNLNHLRDFVNMAVDNTSNNPNYILNKYKMNGVMDNVRISS